MPETIEIITCPYCGDRVPIKEYLDTHYATCPKRLAHPLFKKVKTPLKIVTNEEETPEKFLEKIDEWEKPVPRRDKEPSAAAPLIRNPRNPWEELGEAPVEEPEEFIDEKTYLIRNEILVEANGKVEVPEEVEKEQPEEAPVEEGD